MKSIKIFYTFIVVFILLISFAVINNITKADSDSTDEGYGINIITEASDLPKSDAHKAIVKIKSYSLNEDNKLSQYSSGSGVIINSSGIVLTNHHVVTLEDDFDDTERESSYLVCLTEEIDEEPDCEYSGKLIASDKNLDAALLKIENISGYSNKDTFSYLNLNNSDSTSVNDEVVAMGYPSIGGETITITKGVISGKQNKYDKNWLKTDAVMSYGSSGGAAIDSNGIVVGITSNTHTDTAGRLGYIINTTSLNSWINLNIEKQPQNNSLITQTEGLAKKIINTENSNEFINNSPAYKITKPSDWDFVFEDERGLLIYKGSDDEGGIILISSSKFPYAIDTNVVESNIKRDLEHLKSVATIVKNEEITIDGNKAKKILVSASEQQLNYYYIPVKNYLLEILYDYGKNDKDKVIIDDIIDSIKLIDTGAYLEKKQYTHSNPKFNVELDKDWSLVERNSKDHPLFITYKPNTSFFVDINIEKTDDNTKNLNNEEFLSHIEQKVKEFNNMANIYDFKIEILDKVVHYSLNNDLNNVLMISGVNKSISSDEVLERFKEYYIKSGDKYIVISMNYYDKDLDGFNKASHQLNEMLSSFSMGSSRLAPTINTSKEMNVKNTSMYNNLKGKIVLKVESNGEAIYIHPSNKKMYNLGRPDDSFAVMREQGVGISNENLEKIPIALGSQTGVDSDGDGLSDLFEDAIGTDKNNPDSDGDGYNDKLELEGDYNPNGSGKLKLDNNFSNTQKGKIFLQVEGSGEAWYINPNDNKRYFLGRPADAFEIMRNLGLGISNENFDEL